MPPANATYARTPARAAPIRTTSPRARTSVACAGAASPLTVTGMSAPVTATAHGASTLEARPHQRALEPGGAVGLPTRRLAITNARAVHRPRRRDAVAQLPEAPEILDGRLRARRRAMRITRSPAATGVRAATRGGDGVVLRAVDRPEAHVVARAQQDRIGGASDRRGAPACGRAPRSRPGSPPSRCSTARRRCPTLPGGVFVRGVVEARDVEALGHARHVGQARREADEVDVVVGAGVEPHQLVRRARGRLAAAPSSSNPSSGRRSSTAAPPCARGGSTAGRACAARRAERRAELLVAR